MPPKVTRRSPTNEMSATIDPATPAIAMSAFQLFRWSGRKRSTKRTSRIVPVRTISGSEACRSIEDMSDEQSRQAADGGVGDLEYGARVEAKGGYPDEERRPRRHLDRPDVLQSFSEPLLRRLPEVEPLDQPQHVAGGQDRADAAEYHVGAEQAGGESGGRVEGSEQREHLAPEPRQAGQPERCDRGEREDAPHVGHHLHH